MELANKMIGPISGCAKRCKPALHSTNVSIGTNAV